MKRLFDYIARKAKKRKGFENKVLARVGVDATKTIFQNTVVDDRIKAVLATNAAKSKDRIRRNDPKKTFLNAAPRVRRLEKREALYVEIRSAV